MSTSEGEAPNPESGRTKWPIELIKVLALPLVTLVLGYWFNSSLNERQQIDNNVRLYAEMMGRREEADSNLRKDMFNSILATFMAKDPNLRVTPEEQIRQQILSLELLAYNFHESLDIAPLFKDVGRRIAADDIATSTELRGRLESVALQVIEHQLTALSDVGTVERGDALPDKIKDLQAHVMFGARAIPDPSVRPGEGASRVCLSMEASNGSRHYRQFLLELIGLNDPAREVQVRLYVSKVLTEEQCQQATLDLEGQREIDTNFVVGLYRLPDDRQHAIVAERALRGVVDGAQPERGEPDAGVLPCLTCEPEGQALLRRSHQGSRSRPPTGPLKLRVSVASNDLAAFHDKRDAFELADVRERVARDSHEIGEFALGDRSDVVLPAHDFGVDDRS